MISPKASLYGEIRVHPSSRIDDFAVLSGAITIGRHVHVSCHATLIGEISVGDFAAVSVGARIFARSDDYSGEWMTNPTVPAHLTCVDARPVLIGRHAIVGANAVILPGVTVGEGAAIGAGALITRDVPPWVIVVGRNRIIRKRSRRALELERSCAF